jgi:hypothetical protein
MARDLFEQRAAHPKPVLSATREEIRTRLGDI